jgi:hypothetical protein
MRPYTLKIPAGSEITLPHIGNYVRIKSATVPINVRVLESNESVQLEQGDDATLTAFERLEVSHSDGAEQTVILYVGNNTRQGSSKVGGTLQVNPTQSSTGSQAAAVVGVASAQLLAANSNRKFLLIQNINPTGEITLNLFGAAAVIGAGPVIAPGETFKLEGMWMPTAQINAIGTAAGIACVVLEAQ